MGSDVRPLRLPAQPSGPTPRPPQDINRTACELPLHVGGVGPRFAFGLLEQPGTPFEVAYDPVQGFTRWPQPHRPGDQVGRIVVDIPQEAVPRKRLSPVL